MIVVKAILERLVKTHETEIQEPSSLKCVHSSTNGEQSPCASCPPQRSPLSPTAACIFNN